MSAAARIPVAELVEWFDPRAAGIVRQDPIQFTGNALRYHTYRAW